MILHVFDTVKFFIKEPTHFFYAITVYTEAR